MFYGLNKFIKNLLPKRLFYRALLIIAAPIIILQITISIVFFDSLWLKTNKGMTRALVGEIKTFINAYANEDYKKDFLGKIPINIDLRIAADSGKPLVEMNPNHKISKIFKEMATKVKESFL